MLGLNSEKAARVLSAFLSPIPRMKGFGIVISAIAECFKDEPIQIEKSVFGKRMRLRTDDLIGRALIFTPNYYDREERRLISSIIKPGDYVVDVGANIGTYTLILAGLVGTNGCVDAIEAEKLNAEELRHNVQLNQMTHVVIHEVGISDKPEILQLLLNTTGNAGGHSFFNQPHIAEPQIQLIRCVPLSDIIQNRRPKFMKLDIEGFEYRALRALFHDRSKNLWPQYLMVEDNPTRRENDAIKLCIENGYDEFATVRPNVFLRLGDAWS